VALGRMKRSRLIPLVALALGCGGKAETQAHARSASSGGETSSGGSSSIISGIPPLGSLGGSNDPAGTDGDDQAGTPASTSNYVPDRAAPFDQAYLEDGSFESNSGSGWDTCPTDTAALLNRTRGDASQGDRALEFSSGECAGCYPPNAPSTSQVYLWFRQRPASALSLYFDVLNLSKEAPLGELSLETVDSACRPLQPLATVALSDLALAQSWQTRCVDLPAFGGNEDLGIAVTGASFDIALDALRFGPPCHAR